MIRDLVYFDVEKAASIYSQMTGGLIREVEETSESKDDGSGKFSAKIFGAGVEAGGGISNRSTLLEKRSLHHDLLVKLEEILFNNGLAVNINNAFADNPDIDSLRDSLSDIPYVQATGWSTIEDYGRIVSLSEGFNKLLEFFKQAGLNSVRKSDEYQHLQRQLKEAGQVIQRAKGSERVVAEQKLKALKDQLAQAESSMINADSFDDSMLAGIKEFFQRLMPHRLCLRSYPINQVPEFSMLASLQPAKFSNTDLENINECYGIRPSVKLTLFGIVTDVPFKEGHPFVPAYVSASSTIESIAQSMQSFFAAMEQVDSLVRTVSYPSVMVQPIAIYRQILPRK